MSDNVLAHFLYGDEDVSVKDFFEATWDFVSKKEFSTGEGKYCVVAGEFVLKGFLFIHQEKGVTRVLEVTEMAETMIRVVLAATGDGYRILFNDDFRSYRMKTGLNKEVDPVCPQCGSRNTFIFDGDETSGQTECHDCGHDWPIGG